MHAFSQISASFEPEYLIALSSQHGYFSSHRSRANSDHSVLALPDVLLANAEGDLGLVLVLFVSTNITDILLYI